MIVESRVRQDIRRTQGSHDRTFARRAGPDRRGAVSAVYSFRHVEAESIEIEASLGALDTLVPDMATVMRLYRLGAVRLVSPDEERGWHETLKPH